MDTATIAKAIDHTYLKPDTTSEIVERLCEEAIQYGFASVCVLPMWISLVREKLEGSEVKTCVPIGFPLGGNESAVKAFEAQQTEADELDMVMAIGAAKEGNWDLVESDIRGVVDAAKGRCVKVILETCLLTEDEIRRACECAVTAGASFVKTSTGFAAQGATLEAVRLMRSVVPESVGVKASGGIRTLGEVEQYLEAGATRIGTSNACGIIPEH